MPTEGTATAPRSIPAALWVAVRPRQWTKNLLVLAAPGAAGVLLEPTAALQTALAFGAMTAASSATYLLNDIRDVRGDREHPVKRSRPIAAGTLPTPVAAAAAGVLAVAAVVVPVLADRPLLAVVVVVYGVLTTAYSLGLKHVRLLELVVVAAGFVLRAIAGAVAVDVPVSEWFLIVVSAAALYVVASKRYAEKRDQAVTSRPVLADYTPDLLQEVRTATVAVALVGYLLWAFQIADGAGVPWHPLSAIPFALALFEFGAATHDGAGEAPEDVILAGGPTVGYGLAWAVLFALGTYGTTA
jgi:decaprenyl-phosphate phosphoribosyltransferase